MISWSLDTPGPRIDLYVAENLSELSEKVDFHKTVEDVKVKGTLDALEKQANLKRIEGDQELTYIFLMRFLTLAMDAKRRRLNSVHIDEDNLRKMFQLAEDLKDCLRKRYALKSSAMSQSSQPEMHQKPTTAKEEDNEKPKKSTSDEKENIPVEKKETLWISARELHKLMQSSRSSDSLLIIDCRTGEDYTAGHIDFPGTCNVPENILVPGTTCHKIERHLEGGLFSTRNKVSNVVLVDWESGDVKRGKTPAYPALNSPIWCLFRALTEWNDGSLKCGRPKILLSGYNYFLTAYPAEKTGGSKKIVSNEPEFRKDIDPMMQLGNDNYNFDVFFPSKREQPKIPPKGLPARPEKKPVDARKPTPLAGMNFANIPQVNRSNKPGAKPMMQSQQVPTPAPAGEKSQRVSMDPKTVNTEINQLPIEEIDRVKKQMAELELQKKKLLEDVANIERMKRKAQEEAASIPQPPTSATVVKPEPTPKHIPSDTATEKEVPSEVPSKPEKPVPGPKPKPKKQVRFRARSHSPPVRKPEPKPFVPPVVDRKSKPSHVTPSSSNQNLNNNTKPNVSRALVQIRDDSADPTYLQPVHGPSSSGVSGLKNMGNSCYLASIIQCLAAAPLFSDFYLYSAYKDQIYRRQKLLFEAGKFAIYRTLVILTIVFFFSSTGYSPENYKQPLMTIEMARMVKAMLSGRFRSLVPKGIKQVVGYRKPEFANSRQHDAQEFLAQLLDGLHEEMNCGENSITKRTVDNEEEAPKNENEAWKQYLTFERSLIVDLFHFQLKVTLTCLECKKQTHKYEAFCYLTLPVPEGKGRLTTQDCLGSFFYPEFIDGYRCSNCKKPRNVSRKFDVVRAPSLLIIHLNRFENFGEWRSKKTDPIQFQTDDFRFGGRTYSLFAVCNHFGTMEAGHYIATTRRNLNSSTFFRYDDADVSSLPTSLLMTDERHTQAAYLLFYAAVDYPWNKARQSLLHQV